jgi:TonB family protein
VEIQREFMPKVLINDVAVSFQPMDESIFQVPAKSIEVESCDAMQLPRAVYTPEPDFTEAARKKRREGIVLLYILIGKDGAIAAAKAINSVSDGLDRSAESAVRRWKFSPAICNGHAVAAEMTAEIDFRLAPRR